MTGSSSPGARRRRWAKQSLTDWLLGALGFSMATASASFASYMIATAPAEVTGSGSKDFNVFVRWDKRTLPGAVHSPARQPEPDVATAAAPPPAPLARQASAGIDLTPTGSVPDDANVTRAARVTAPATGPLREFRVRDVIGDRALIEHRSRLTLVQPGSILAGAGEVLAIERQGAGWIVRTASGVIGGS